VVGLAVALVAASRALWPSWRSWFLSTAAGASVAWTAGAALLVWPHGLCYVNEFWGGTDKGYLCISDANYDWGQGLKELAEWQQRQGDVPVDVWYFGSDPGAERLPMRVVPLHILPIDNPDDVLAQVRGHYLAVSTTLLYGMVSDTPAHRHA